MRSRLQTLAALAVAVSILAAGSALASTFLKVDIQDLKKMSEAVVQARVVEVRSYWNADQTMIFTEAALEVKGRLHGKADDLLVVRTVGGTVDDYTVDMGGAPRFAVGDEIVAFIGRWDDGEPMVAGYAAGMSRVRKDSIGQLVLEGGVADGLPVSELARQLRQSR
jgi:predicted protein tyrosine phosphatase